jgi:hypothetical protein
VAVLSKIDSLDIVEKVSGVFRPSFNNYVVAEILTAPHACLQHVDLTAVTDSMALVRVIDDPTVTWQKRFRRRMQTDTGYHTQDHV